MTFEFEKREEDGERYVYLFDGPRAALSAVRRSLIRDAETLAVDEVEMYENTSVMYDETIAHRLGLVPLRTEPGEFVPQGECSCEGGGCSNCEARLSLQAEAPDDGSLTVYSGDVTGDVEVADPDIPVARLHDGQRLLLKATARLGQGADHVKWSGAVAPAIEETDEGTAVAFETDGSMEADELLEKAVEKQVEKLDDLLETLGDLS